METGEAGPPGYIHRVTVRRGSEDSSSQPVQGFAGAPGECCRWTSFHSYFALFTLSRPVNRTQGYLGHLMWSLSGPNYFQDSWYCPRCSNAELCCHRDKVQSLFPQICSRRRVSMRLTSFRTSSAGWSLKFGRCHTRLCARFLY